MSAFRAKPFAIALRLAVAGALAGGAPMLRAADDAEWDYSGTNTLRGETYNSRGNLAASPYQSEGAKAYNELSINLQRRVSEYDVWRAQVHGLINGSDYRSPFDGVVPERMTLSREKGDGVLPHRFELGDYFGYFSYRTLQRSLKGGMLELQPRVTSADEWRYSVVMLTGSGVPGWRQMSNPEEDYTSGISVLMQTPGNTRIIGNFLTNHRGGVPLFGTLNRHQDVFSLGAEHVMRWGTQLLTFEGEGGTFSGDHDGLSGPASGLGRAANAYYGQVSGRSLALPFTYRLRAERNEQDYRPHGAVVTPDRRAFEGHAGWTFESNLALRGRVQYFTDALQTGNQTDTRTWGFNLAGPFLPQTVSGLTGTLDAFRQDSDRRDRGIDRTSNTINFNASKPLSNDWLGRFGLFSQSLRDRAVGGVDVKTHQITFAADHAAQIGGFTGTISPGIALRFVRGGLGETDDVNPTLAVNMTNGPHRFGLNFGLLAQQPPARLQPTVTDVYTTQYGADYRYTRGLDTWGIEANFFERSPDRLASTSAYRIGVFWSHSFEKTAAGARAPLVSDPVGSGAALPRSVAVLLSLSPGSMLDAQLKRLEESGYRGGASQPGAVVFETRLLDEIDQRQRLVLAHEGGSIVKSALIIDLTNVGGAETPAQTFERVRRSLLDRFGRPVTTFDEGAFGPGIAADLATGRFVRVMEWTTESGRLRLGIPRRLDNTVRIEIQHAKSFPQPRDPAWSLETVR